MTDNQQEIKMKLLKRIGFTNDNIERLFRNYDFPMQELVYAASTFIEEEKNMLERQAEALQGYSTTGTFDDSVLENKDLLEFARELRTNVKQSAIPRDSINENKELRDILLNLAELRKKNKPYRYYFTEDSIKQLMNLNILTEENQYYFPGWSGKIPPENDLIDAIAGRGMGAYVFNAYHWCNYRWSYIENMKDSSLDYDAMGKFVRYCIDNNAIYPETAIEVKKQLLPGVVKDQMIVKGYIKKAKKGWYYVDMDEIFFEY